MGWSLFTSAQQVWGKDKNTHWQQHRSALAAASVCWAVLCLSHRLFCLHVLSGSEGAFLQEDTERLHTDPPPPLIPLTHFSSFLPPPFLTPPSVVLCHSQLHFRLHLLCEAQPSLSIHKGFLQVWFCLRGCQNDDYCQRCRFPPVEISKQLVMLHLTISVKHQCEKWMPALQAASLPLSCWLLLSALDAQMGSFMNLSTSFKSQQ